MRLEDSSFASLVARVTDPVSNLIDVFRDNFSSSAIIVTQPAVRDQEAYLDAEKILGLREGVTLLGHPLGGESWERDTLHRSIQQVLSTSSEYFSVVYVCRRISLQGRLLCGVEVHEQNKGAERYMEPPVIERALVKMHFFM